MGAWATTILAFAVAPSESTHWRRWMLLLSFVVWIFLAPMFGGHVPSGAGAARALDFLLIPGAAVAIALLNTQELVNIGMAAAVALLLSTGVAGFQYFGVWPPESAFASLAWTKLSFARVYETVPGAEDRFMAGGILFHRLKYANVSAVFVVLGAAAAALRVPRFKFFAFATLIGFLGVSIFPHARAASAALVLTMAVVWISSATNKRRASVAVSLFVLFALAMAMLIPSVRTRFETAFSSGGSGERRSITQSGLSAIQSSPLVGVGLGRFRPGLYLPVNAPAQAREHPGKAHNQFVTLAAEAGILAAVLITLFLLKWLFRGLQQLPAGSFVVGATVLFLLLGLLHDPLFQAESSFALMLLLGIGIGAIDRSRMS
jgi:O-antigen ligase